MRGRLPKDSDAQVVAAYKWYMKDSERRLVDAIAQFGLTVGDTGLSEAFRRLGLPKRPRRTGGTRLTKATKDATDRRVFEYIVEYKTAHDGMSPTFRQMQKSLGYSQVTFTNSITRLIEAGKVQSIGNGRHRNFTVIGGRWSYKEPEFS